MANAPLKAAQAPLAIAKTSHCDSGPVVGDGEGGGGEGCGGAAAAAGSWDMAAAAAAAGADSVLCLPRR